MRVLRGGRRRYRLRQRMGEKKNLPRLMLDSLTKKTKKLRKKRERLKGKNVGKK